MTRLSPCCAVSLAAMAAFSVAGAARGQVYLTGRAPGTGGSRATALSADGRVAAGTSTSVPANPGFTWSVGFGRNDFGTEAGLPTTTSVYAVNANGTAVAGGAWNSSGTELAFRYRGPGTYESIGTMSGYAISEAHGISGDGAIVVGQARDLHYFSSSAFRWTASGGMQSLGFTRPSHFYSDATAISRDGGSIVGFSYNGSTTDAFIWTQATGMTALHGLNGRRAHAYGVNGTGTIVVGTADFEDTGGRGVLWENGSLLDLGFNQSVGAFSPAGVSDDGAVVVGQVGATWAGIWTPTTGILMLGEYLAVHGISGPAGWQFKNATAVSADGRTIAGWGYSEATGTQGFVVTIPAPASLVAFAGLFASIRRTRWG